MVVIKNDAARSRRASAEASAAPASSSRRRSHHLRHPGAVRAGANGTRPGPSAPLHEGAGAHTNSTSPPLSPRASLDQSTNSTLPAAWVPAWSRERPAGPRGAGMTRLTCHEAQARGLGQAQRKPNTSGDLGQRWVIAPARPDPRAARAHVPPPAATGGKPEARRGGGRRATSWRRLLTRQRTQTPTRGANSFGASGGDGCRAFTPTRNAVGPDSPVAVRSMAATGEPNPWRSILPPRGGGEARGASAGMT